MLDFDDIIIKVWLIKRLKNCHKLTIYFLKEKDPPKSNVNLVFHKKATNPLALHWFNKTPFYAIELFCVLALLSSFANRFCPEWKEALSWIGLSARTSETDFLWNLHEISDSAKLSSKQRLL